MTLAPGSRIGPYEILAAIGAGGMGEVFRARDTTLNRDVAIKVLPAAFAQDHERVARFKREAQVLASLNHPNLAAIYGLEEAGARHASTEERGPGMPDPHGPIVALILELVEGEDLAQRLSRGAIPVDEAITIAKQIAEALEEAHEHGIVHRDLKPANVKVTPEGKVKVLDFGLAKAFDSEAGTNSASAEISHSPTMSRHATEAGIILGTAAYMSPEQARGKTVDKRADIWSFGVVLFEMLTGERLFAGETVSDVLAAVLTREPDWKALPATTPVNVRRIVRRCLEKDRRQRIRDMGDVRLDFDVHDDPRIEPPAVAGRRSTLDRVLFAAAALIISILGVTAARHLLERPLTPAVTRFELALPPKSTTVGLPEISPDGQQLAAIAVGDDGVPMIWIRRMDSVAFLPLAGTEGASYPFWSPNSRALAFFADEKLKKILVAGGPPETLCPAPRARGGSWSKTGVLLFSGLAEKLEQLLRVSEAGGTPAIVKQPLPEGATNGQRWPHFLPDGKRFLFFALTRKPETQGVWLGSLDDGAGSRLILKGFTEARYSEGFLVFVRDTVLMSQPFDPISATLSGDPVPLGGSVLNRGNEGGKGFSVSDSGALVTTPAPPPVKSQLRWLDRRGQTVGMSDPPGGQSSPRISPDGSRIAALLGRSQVAVKDARGGRFTRFTFDEGGFQSPTWSPDGGYIAFSKITGVNGLYGMYRQATNGAPAQDLLLEDGLTAIPFDISPDGQRILYGAGVSQTVQGLKIFSLKDRSSTVYVSSDSLQGPARISPDGHWAAVQGNESGRNEIYVYSFPSPGTKVQISQNGGALPIWNRNGRELFFVSGGKVVAAPVDASGGTLRVGTLSALFDVPPTSATGTYNYDVAPDGRFLVNVPTETSRPVALVTLNWTKDLRAVK